MVEVERHPPERWAATVAEPLTRRLVAADALRLCLPTGTTPAPVYRELTAATARGELGFADAEVILLDEFGGLAPDDPARSERMLRTQLLDHVDLPDHRFLRPDVDAADLDAAVADFGAAVAAGGIDLAVVGLGANGHVGLNEPGSARESTVRRTGLAPETTAAARRYGDGAAAPTWGVTLGIAELLAAGEVWLLVTGDHKAGILQRVLEGPIGAHAPASWLREHPRLRVLADQPAAAALRAGSPPG